MNDQDKIYARVNSPEDPMTVTTVRVSPSDAVAPAMTTEDDEDEDESKDQYEDLPIVKFIGEKMKKRECKRFVQNGDGPLCRCGYEKRRHPIEAIDVGGGGSRDNRWDVNVDTLESPTDAFGEMEIQASGLRISKYIRVDYRTSVDDLLLLMKDHWEMELPNLLISVTGGAQNFTMKPRLKEVFRQGLVKAAESTRAWIITGGTNAGVMKHVGEALYQHTTKHGNKKQLVALGIATWGCIENRENLISQPSKKDDGTFVGCWPAQYKCSETLQKKKESPLDPNHTHFILVDNGTQQAFGVEIDLRTKLESAISRKKTKEGSVSIPVVCVVLEGGPNTLETVKNAIETGTPAIIVAGSGRAADILAYAYSQCEEKEVEVNDELEQKQKQIVALYDDKLWEEVAKRVKSEFKKDGEAFIRKSVDCVRACIDRIDHLTVFRLDGGSSAKDIDITILRALLKVNRGKGIDQLRLALAWDRVDVAKEEIFTDGVRFEDSDLHELMFFAIANNRLDFVKLFLDKGVSLKEFLTVERIHQLYNDSMARGRCVQLEKKAKNNVISLKNVGSLMKELSGELFEPEYNKPLYKHDPNTLKRLSSSRTKTTVSIALGPISPIVKEPFDEPARDLFIWSVLHRMKDMAMVFWFEGKEDTALATLGHLLLKGLLEQEQDPDQADDLQEQVTFFEDLSVGLLAECHSSDQRKTIRLLIRELPGFGKTTTLKMAVQADNKNFVAHPACQNLLTEIWTGKLTDDNHKYKLLISIFCPFVAPLLLKFRDDYSEESRYQKSSNRQSATRSSVDYSRKESQAQLVNGSTYTTNVSRNSASPPSASSSSVKTYFERIGFFFRAPVIKFSYSCIAYFAFLLLFGIILLTDFYPTIGIKEEILIAWVVTILLEEIRQMAMDDAGEVGRKLYNYINDIWNILDVITIVTFIAGMILRFIPVSVCAQCFYAARIILALNFMTFFFRVLNMFSIHRQLGPKLVMIGQMMIDLFYFMIILMVFIAAYGIASQIILYPNQPLNIGLARDVLSKSWWTIFGELSLDEVSGDSCSYNATELTAADVCASMDYAEYSEASCAGRDEQCPAINWLVPIILAIYALVTNVLMLNLLIAMFSNTFSNIQGQTNLVWKMQRYHLVREYDTRPLLPPPLIFLAHIFLFLRFILRRMKCCSNKNWCLLQSYPSGFRETFTNAKKHEEKELLYWENVNAEELLRKKEAEEREAVSHKTKETNDRVDTILQKVEEIAETNFLLHSSSPNVQPQLPPLLEDRLQYLEKQMQRTSKALDLILKNMGLQKELPDVDEEIQKEKERQKMEAKKRIEDAKEELEKRMKLHKMSRDSIYPKGSSGHSVSRTHVPDTLVSFETEFKDYAPEDFTDSSVKDPSDHPPSYPMNPKGRTGLRGRGVLPFWGPNYVITVVITRWKYGQQEKLLEFLSIQRANNDQSVPETKPVAQQLPATLDEHLKSAVRGCFEEVLSIPTRDEPVLWKAAKEVYRGYLDDYRNTDNAWIETTTLNCHLRDDKNGDDIEFKISPKVSWKPLRSDLTIYGPHLPLLQRVAKRLEATF